MAEPWIRVHAGLIDKPVVGRLVDALRVNEHEAIGLLVSFWSGVARTARRGDLSNIPDGSLERWARWPLRRGQKKGAFAAFIREHHVDENGRVREWDKYAGRLEDRKERDESPDGKSTYVYYAVAGDECKIGWSGNPWARVNELRTGRPGIRVVATEKGRRELEIQRHEQFATAHIEREWFRLTDELRSHIRSLSVVGTVDDSVAATVVTTELTTEEDRSSTVVSRAPARGRDGTVRNEKELNSSSSSPERDAVLNRLVTDAGVAALNAVCARAATPNACIAALAAIVTGNDPATPKPARDVFESALIDYAANGEPWNAALFRRYLERAGKARASSAPTPIARNGAKPTIGEQSYAEATAAFDAAFGRPGVEGREP